MVQNPSFELHPALGQGAAYPPNMSDARDARCLTVVLFEGFELLDVFGPVELMSMVPGVQVRYVGAETGSAVTSSQGARVVADLAYGDVEDLDIVLVPGGKGTRPLVNDDPFLRWLRERGEQASIVASVCTGSALLAAAGLLDGHRATSNKLAFEWASSFGRSVDWQPRARWVEDRDRWTSSGVSAGMDMSAALITRLFGHEAAALATRRAEYEPHRDSEWDPFARTHGLT